VATPYAFLAYDVTAARQNFDVAGTLTVNGAAIAASFTGSGSGLTGINTNNLVQEVVRALCPPGTIVAFGGVNIPSGWLLCDGTSYSRTVYPRLFSAIGTACGNSGGTNNFNLPDLRGMFLRGVNSGRTGIYRDPDAAQRVAAVTGGNTGNNVGSVQTNQFGIHNHINDIYNLIMKNDGTFTATFTDNGNEPNIVYTASMLPAGGNETRPNNAYVNYIIKY
jgi:microcystin-dependent protein